MHARTVARAAVVSVVAATVLMGGAVSAFACGGLVAPNGTISLTRTTTLAAYHRGIEHYLFSFSYAGKVDGSLGSITPLPGVPTKIIKGGDWTLQRLNLEVHPVLEERAAALAPTTDLVAGAEVLMRAKVDSLDITVLKGGAVAVGNWAREHGFFLPPDAPEVLAFYADRSPIFMATRFNAQRAAAQGLAEGEGTPVHVVIPTPNPWVPLRILSLGRSPQDVIQADVFLLTDRAPAMLPQALSPNGDQNQQGIVQERSEPASASLMSDLRSDSRSKWIPNGPMWFTYLKIDTPASTLNHDLAIDASGFGHPDPIAAGYPPASVPIPTPDAARTLLWLGAGLALVALFARRRIQRSVTAR
ncbi:MAG: DUF2330 domain-containing protein [Actinomycetota bacterium]